MNLWQRLELRGREELSLDDTWHMYAADLSDNDNWAEVKFSRKDGDNFISKKSIVGNVKYLDIR